MSVNKPGLPKLNVKSELQSSFKSAVSSKLASSTRTGYGIQAQRSRNSDLFNVKRYNSYSISEQRHYLNDNRVVIKNNNLIGTPVATHQCSGDNKFATALAVTSMLSQIVGSAASLTKSSNSGVAGNTQMQKAGSNSVINDLATAKNSSEIQEGLAKLETEMTECETKIADAEKTIKEETELKSQNETKLKDTETQIQGEKQNITKQEGMITKLESSITQDKFELERLESSLSTCTGDLTKMALETQISELKAKIAQEEQQLDEAKESKKASEKKLEELGNTKKDLTNQIATNEKNIQSAEAEKNSATSKQEKLEAAQTKYSKKLTETQNKESKELSKLHTEIAKYAKEFSETSDVNKKNKLSEKYTEKAKEYNELVKNTSVSGYTEVGTDLNSL